MSRDAGDDHMDSYEYAEGMPSAVANGPVYIIVLSKGMSEYYGFDIFRRSIRIKGIRFQFVPCVVELDGTKFVQDPSEDPNDVYIEWTPVEYVEPMLTKTVPVDPSNPAGLRQVVSNYSLNIDESDLVGPDGSFGWYAKKSSDDFPVFDCMCEQPTFSNVAKFYNDQTKMLLLSPPGKRNYFIGNCQIRQAGMGKSTPYVMLTFWNDLVVMNGFLFPMRGTKSIDSTQLDRLLPQGVRSPVDMRYNINNPIKACIFRYEAVLNKNAPFFQLQSGESVQEKKVTVNIIPGTLHVFEDKFKTKAGFTYPEIISYFTSPNYGGFNAMKHFEQAFSPTGESADLSYQTIYLLFFPDSKRFDTYISDKVVNTDGEKKGEERHSARVHDKMSGAPDIFIGGAYAETERQPIIVKFLKLSRSIRNAFYFSDKWDPDFYMKLPIQTSAPAGGPAPGPAPGSYNIDDQD